ncbi:MAG: hypothetical protein JNL74_15880 [Fibrobacteres bacterium]|nr:hypothetical protein [Fibrobacterota bacterium]
MSAWLTGGAAEPHIQALLRDFGMDARNSTLAPAAVLQNALSALNPTTLNWINSFSLPLHNSLSKIINPATARSLAAELSDIYTVLSEPGVVSISGGFVAASKAIHALFPALTPMIDGAHTGISYYNILRNTYTPPLGLDNWNDWLGHPLNGVVNPSPRGAGRNSWGADQFLCAIGLNQHIYENWQAANGNHGIIAFIALDSTPGATGVTRIIDKLLW